MFLKGGCGALLGWLLSEKSQHVPCPYALYLGRFIVAHGSELWSALPALSCQFSVCWLFLGKKPKAHKAITCNLGRERTRPKLLLLCKWTWGTASTGGGSPVPLYRGRKSKFLPCCCSLLSVTAKGLFPGLGSGSGVAKSPPASHAVRFRAAFSCPLIIFLKTLHCNWFYLLATLCFSYLVFTRDRMR